MWLALSLHTDPRSRLWASYPLPARTSAANSWEDKIESERIAFIVDDQNALLPHIFTSFTGFLASHARCRVDVTSFVLVPESS